MLKFLLTFLCCWCHLLVEAQIPCEKLKERLAEDGICPENNRYPCVDFCSDRLITGEEECNGTTHCCYENSTCFLKQLQNASENVPFTSNPFDQDEVGEEFLEKFSGEERSLSTGGGFDTVLALFPDLPLCVPFPDNCQVTYTSPSDLEPPVNIPYCQRIACRSDNPFLETDPGQCLTNPGCAFDFNLAFYRNIFGHAIIPTAPVCHLAIRNEIFLRNASAFAEQSGQPWNPLFTNCLIDNLQDEIFIETNGCAKLKVLRELGHQPKQAGWKGISSRDCRLINGCWLKEACYYPVADDEIKINSDYDTPHFDNYPVGRPECLPFDSNSTNSEFLDSYHSCLRAGCFTDVAESMLTSHLFLVGVSSLPPHLQSQYFNFVLSGHARADNYRQVLNSIIAFDSFRNNLLMNNSSPLNADARTASVSGGGTNSIPLNLSTTDVEALAEITTSGENVQPLTPDLQNLGEMESRFGLSNSISPEDLVSILFPLCPFQPFTWPGLPPLMGSFEGCCDTPLCYLPRSSIRNAHSEIATYIASWSPWSACSSTCGPGFQSRGKFCIGELCDDLESEVQPCNPGACPIYTSWAEFGECNATCGGGVKVRQRKCLVEQCNLENLRETAPCNTEACPIRLYSPWTEYGECGATCGGGVKVRERECMIDECSPKQLRETVPCNTGRCPTVRAAQWSECSNTCGVGVQRRIFNCINPGDYECPEKWYQERRCERFCGQYRYISSRCNQKTCKILRTSKCLQGDGKPGHCRPSRRPPPPLERKCFEGPCRCRHSPNHRDCRPNRGRGMGERVRGRMRG